MASWQDWKSRFGTALFLGALSSQAAYAVPVLSFSASPTPATVGSPVAVSVLVTGAVDLYGYQFTLGFNPALFRATSVTEGVFLSSGGNTTFFDGGNINNTTGSVSFVFDTLVGAVAGVSGNGVLARITFNTIAAGTSAITFGDVLMLDSTLATVTTQVQNGVLQAVPEPATMLLFGLGLAGVAGLATARRRAQ